MQKGLTAIFFILFATAFPFGGTHLTTAVANAATTTQSDFTKKGSKILNKAQELVNSGKPQKAIDRLEEIYEKPEKFSSKDLAYSYITLASAYSKLDEWELTLSNYYNAYNHPSLSQGDRRNIALAISQVEHYFKNYEKAKNFWDEWNSRSRNLSQSEKTYGLRVHLMIADLDGTIEYLSKLYFDQVNNYRGNLEADVSLVLKAGVSERREAFNKFIEKFVVTEITTREPRPSKTVPPVYPETAAEANIQGWVRFRFGVSKDGRVLDPVVIDSDPKKVFETAAQDALMQWTFLPKIEDGEIVAASDVEYQITFKLEN